MTDTAKKKDTANYLAFDEQGHVIAAKPLDSFTLPEAIDLLQRRMRELGMPTVHLV